jgi:hypothetical protein
MQYGVRVISIKRTGSQKPSEIPGTGKGGVPLMHMHNGLLGLAVSRLLGTAPPPIFTGPIEMGSKQLQQTSLIGLTNLPEHGTLACADIGMIIAINSIIICLFKYRSWSVVVVRQDSKLLTSLNWDCRIFFFYSVLNIMLLKIILILVLLLSIMLILSGSIPALSMLNPIGNVIVATLKFIFSILRATWPLLLIFTAGYFLAKSRK